MYVKSNVMLPMTTLQNPPLDCPGTNTMPRPPKDIVLSPVKIGERLRDLRVRRDMSQAALAATLSTKQSNISDIERGTRGLTIQQLVKICRVLKTTPNAVLGEKEAAEKNTPPHDRRLLRQMQQLQALPKRKRQALLTTLDAFLMGAGHPRLA